MEPYNVDVLLLEDNLDDADITIRAFEKNNISNTLVHLINGEEALDLFFFEGSKMLKIDGLEL